jgi:opacity protein-like surface antigen
MKTFLLGGVALAAIIGGPALAADMPVAPLSPPVVYYDWSGAYIGFNAGGVWTQVDQNSPNRRSSVALDPEMGKASRPAPAMESSASTPARNGSGAPGFALSAMISRTRAATGSASTMLSTALRRLLE